MNYDPLPTTFRNNFEQAKAQLAKAQAVAGPQIDTEHGRQLLHSAIQATQELKVQAPELVGGCLDFAITLEDSLVMLLKEKDWKRQLPAGYAHYMCADWRRALRKFHFAGEMALHLNYFRERYLSAAEDGELRKTIQQQGAAVEQAIDNLLGHVINEVIFEAQERTALRQAAHALARFRAASPNVGGLTKDDLTVRRRQYIRVVGLLCLRIYGHCTTDLMVRLLELKQAYYLQACDDKDEDGAMLAREKSINRELIRLRTLAMKRARNEDWETAPLVEAFFSSAQWKAWPRQADAMSRTWG